MHHHPHAILVNKCLERLHELGCLAWRNDVGAGEVIRKGCAPRYIKWGLDVGSSDIIGLTPDGRFLAIEAKTGNATTSKEQDVFIAAVNNSGGIAAVVRDVSEIETILRRE